VSVVFAGHRVFFRSLLCICLLLLGGDSVCICSFYRISVLHRSCPAQLFLIFLHQPLACCSALRQSSIPCARMEMAQSVEALASQIDSRTRVPVWSPQLRLRLVGCCHLLRDRGMCLLYRAMAVSRIRVPRIQIPRGDRQTVGRHGLSPHRTHLWHGRPDRNVKGSAEHCEIIRVSHSVTSGPPQSQGISTPPRLAPFRQYNTIIQQWPPR